MRAHLHRLRRAGGGRRHDRRLHAAGRGIGGDRRAAVAGAVLQHVAHALRAQQRQHHAGAAVLEAAGRHEPLAFQQRRRAVQRAADQRRAALAHADRLVGLQRQRGAIAPQAARRRCRSARGSGPAAASAAAAPGPARTSAAGRAERSGRCAGRGKQGTWAKFSSKTSQASRAARICRETRTCHEHAWKSLWVHVRARTHARTRRSCYWTHASALLRDFDLSIHRRCPIWSFRLTRE